MVVTPTDLEMRRWAAQLIGDLEWPLEAVERMDAELIVERLCVKLAEAQARLGELDATEPELPSQPIGAAETLPNALGSADTRHEPMGGPDQSDATPVPPFGKLIEEALEGASVVAFVWNMQTGKLQYTSPGEQVPWLRRRLMLDSFADFCETIHPDERANFMEELSNALQTGATMRVEHRVLLPDDTYAWARIEGHTVPADSGDSSLFVGILIDAEDFGGTAAKGQGDPAFELLDAAPITLAIIDRDSMAILAVNRTGCARYGFSPDEFAQMSLQQLCAPEDWGRALKTLSTLRSTHADSDYKGVWRLRTKAGEAVAVEIRSAATIYRGRKARIVACLEVASADPASPRTGDALQAEPLEQLGAFTGGVAHDFNNLLTGILGNADLALAETGDPRIFDYLIQIETAARRATELSRQLLAKSQKEPSAVARPVDRGFDSNLGYDKLRPDWRGSGTILVVDDEAAIRNLAATMLERVGFTVLTASDGIEATHVFERRFVEIRAVVLDMTMPRMGGDQTLSELRRIDPSVRVLLSSGYSEKEASSRFAGRDVAGFIEKPYRAEQLLAAIKHLLEV